ncbi:protein FAR1-RELATED SEQUENCE 5-like isoform X2 [Salvia hispanica]|uniref:protein FAR1-RELATED SEQUENCE 5-like isoform X2 n=1 Tax=Salvia hispanica TaxID=49212 RepID=UPI0020091628|nr:protein FAR1-RELATED SEQUENCE 5-like isoform X2 [Salvia hispanica]
MVEPKYKQFMKVNRNLDFVHLKFAEDYVKANIGPTMTFNLLKEVMGGYDAVGCTMRTKKELCDGFYYAYELDADDKLTRLFWSDAVSRRNYHMFGDVVSFDTTYSTNRYCMIFTPFTACMGAHPRLIITDQDPAMKPAIENVLRGTRHRWYLLEPEEFEESWNSVMERYGLEEEGWFKTMYGHRQFWVPAYFRDLPMGCLLKTTSISESENSFFKRFSRPHFNLVEFMLQYGNALDAQRIQTTRLDYIDSTNVPSPLTELPFEMHAATIYTDSIFKKVHVEIVEASKNCMMTHMSVETNIRVYKVTDRGHRTWTVTNNAEDDLYECQCKLYQRCGILCRHIFFVFKNNDVQLIPEIYIGKRWLKKPLLISVHSSSTSTFQDQTDSVYDDKHNATNKLHTSYYRLVQRVEGSIADINAVIAAIEDVENQLFGDGSYVMSVLEKKKRFEELYGVVRPDIIHAHPPNVVKCKGSGSRLPSKMEAAKKAAAKPPRRCEKCHKMVNHNSRNCGKEKSKK